MSLKLKHDNKNIEIKFEHRQDYTAYLVATKGSVSRLMSVAILFIDNQSKCIAKSICHPNDNFSKVRGRKIALTRAIANLDKSTRTAIWKAYLKCMKF